MKKNKLTTAILAGVVGMTGVANAVHINPEGTGEVLIYPYFTVNNGLNTQYSVVNTTGDTKAVKVRFLEGENSIEVLDFNLYLSPYDVWTGVLGGIPSSGHPGHEGQPSTVHASTDNSCAPGLLYGVDADGGLVTQEFLPYLIENDAVATSGGVYFNDSMERGREGHFEVIEMGTVVNVSNDFAPAYYALHDSDGVPNSCGALRAAWDGGTWSNNSGEGITDPTGGLFGAVTVLDVANGLAMSYDAIALDDFWGGGAGNHTDPGTTRPNLAQAVPTSSVFVDGVAAVSDWNEGYEAVSALFMRNQIFNEYGFDTDNATKSEWVINFPTKNYHVNGGVLAPFEEYWNGVRLFRSCDRYSLTLWDREEKEEEGSVLVSPRPPESITRMCYETNVIEFVKPGQAGGSASGILGSTHFTTVQGVPNAATENGWARLNFTSGIMTPISGTGYGTTDAGSKPVTGFMVQKFGNANASEGLLAQYAGLFQHKGEVVSF